MSPRPAGPRRRLARWAILLASPLLLASASVIQDAVPGACRGIEPSASVSSLTGDEVAHGGGLNACGCHFNRKTGECHCHQSRGCGCACQPATCPG